MNVPAPNADLLALRHAIDGIDDALAALLVSRVCLSHQAQALKARAGLPALDRAREVEIQHRYEQRWCGASAVALAILNLCRED
ncbi:MAG TPA: chorismate mutase [Verrucomicrobiota bacterium]|nr:chorismate mutase [Verrucomicrobiota bacterium]HNU50171.1 chorismate mutase [Verrucomicrobiota bacterium]